MKTTWLSRHPTYGYVLSNFWTKLSFYISTSGSTGGNVSANVKTFAYNFWPNTIRWSSPEFPKRNKKEKNEIKPVPLPCFLRSTFSLTVLVLQSQTLTVRSWLAVTRSQSGRNNHPWFMTMHSFPPKVLTSFGVHSRPFFSFFRSNEIARIALILAVWPEKNRQM